LLVALGCFVVAWLSARAGLAHVEHATKSIAPEDIVVGNNLGPLRSARDDFAVASDLTNLPFVRVFEHVPYVGRQLSAVRTLDNAASSVLDTGVNAIERSQVAVSDIKRGGEPRVEGMRLIASVAATAQARVAAVNLGHSRGLVSPLADARARFARRIPKLTKALGDLHTVATGLTSFLDGTHLYLVFAANNDEMRLGSGAFLSGSLLWTSHGNMVLYPMQSTANWLLPPGEGPAMSADQAQLWGSLAPNREWRDLASSPRFDTTAELALRMGRVRYPKIVVDGVLAIDPVALEGIISATGPVTVGGRSLSGDALLHYVFVDQYRGASITDPKQLVRRDALGEIEQQSMARLSAGHWDTRALVHALRTVSTGRHFLAWSTRPVEERAWKIAGIDGTLPDDAVTVGVHNRAGNKLDPFLAVSGALAYTTKADGVHVAIDVTLVNKAPKGLPSYVAGPYPGARNAREGRYQGILAFYVPAGATGLHVASHDVMVANGRDGPHRVVGVQVHVDRGRSDHVRLSFVLPRGTPQVEVTSSARYPAIHWTSTAGAWDDTATHTVALVP
jgi:hypothetical protein